MYMYIYIYTYIHLNTITYIHIYIEREREMRNVSMNIRNSPKNVNAKNVYLYPMCKKTWVIECTIQMQSQE